MKSTVLALSLALLLFFTLISAVAGLGEMIISVYMGNSNFFHGFQVFCLSLILFFVATISYMVTKILSNTDVLVDTLAKFVEHEMGKMTTNPLQALFGGMGGLGNMGFPGTHTTIKIGSLDENGNIVPLDESQFDSKDEFLKFREGILNQTFGGQKPSEVKRKLEDMTVAELETEKEKAVSEQKFERAAAILSLIQEKKKS